VGRVATTQGCNMARTKKRDESHSELRVESIEEYLERGGKITVCPPGMRTADLEPMGSPRGYGKKRKSKKA
jgi:hypothetical protein